MTTALLLCICLGSLSACLWLVEILPYFKELKRIKNDSNTIRPFYKFMAKIYAIRLLFPLVLDITCTMILCQIFGLAGVFGTAIALGMSDIIGLAVVIKLWRK